MRGVGYRLVRRDLAALAPRCRLCPDGGDRVGGLLGVLVYERTAGEELDRARDRVAEEVRTARVVLETEQFVLLGASVDADAAPRQLRAAVRSGHLATLVVGTGASARVWAGAPTSVKPGPLSSRGPNTIFVSESFADEDRALASLRRTLVVSGLLAAVAAATVGVALTQGISSRLRRAARAAQRVAGGELDVRVATGGRDEVAALATAINHMADALSTRIERERAFAGDAAHELRTPVAALVAASELLPPGPTATIVRASIADLRRLVENLLELSRAEGGLDRIRLDEVDLSAVAAQRSAYTRLSMSTSICPSPVITDLRRVERVVANLVENAIRHGAPPVTVRARERTLVVDDGGAGFPDELLVHVTERFVVGHGGRSHGAGLGLAIAAEHARVLGASLTFANRPEGGARATLALPAVDLDSWAEHEG